MKVPSLLISALFVAAIAAVNALIGYFNVGGDGETYAYATIIVAVLSTLVRYLQEKSSEYGEALRSASSESAVKKALIG